MEEIEETPKSVRDVNKTLDSFRGETMKLI